MTAVNDVSPQQIQVGEAGLSSDLSEEPPYIIHGVAIAAGDVTRGQEGVLKKWPEETLREAADSLTGKNLVTDHENTVHSVVGEITEARFRDGEVQFKAELDDRGIAESVANGRLDVSARILHRETEELEKDDQGAYVIDLAHFDNLSFVLKPGAAPSNDVGVGATASMSAGELAGTFGGVEEMDHSVSYDGTMGGKLDESKIPSDSYKSNYLFADDTKSDSSFPLVDHNGNLRRGNVESAWDMRGHAPEDIEDYLRNLSKEFENSPVPDSSEENAGSVEEVGEESGEQTTSDVSAFVFEDSLV